ncbi:sulfate adenylyltransferase isoform B [Micractinium conductrix]|uniref:Sulfate adenylyltransferase isoform B n=1 Tax=Micractinium conductrix TaxID=554055 RepID=A0A2P6VCM1_9CHLO|nr:sulfate adenylyltransferase isoform B [Micractinium conductrix]|eukprot:PSC71838.1 sulfate adenylyltransferase isoform B [Micractinium conductrix]
MPRNDAAHPVGEQGAQEFEVAFSRYQAEQALPIDRVSKGLSLAMWGAGVCKCLSRGYRREAALAAAVAAAALLLLCASVWSRGAYVRRLCRHSDNILRFFFILMLQNGLAAINSWPMLGLRTLLGVQLVSVGVMLPRLQGVCQAVLATDAGAQRLLSATVWVLGQAFSVDAAGPPWGPSSAALHEAECLQVNAWWLLLCSTAGLYVSWLREQRAREGFARQLGSAGEPQLRRLRRRHPMYSHNRPVLLMAIELYALAAIIWESLRVALPGALLADAAGPAGGPAVAAAIGRPGLHAGAPHIAIEEARMGFEIKDETVLRVSGVASALYGVHALASPRNFHDTWNEKDQPYNESTQRWFGMAVSCTGAQSIVLSASDANQKALKSSLKTVGTVWAGVTGMTLYNAEKGYQKRELAYAAAAGQAAMAALCLWRGFKDDDDS